MRGRIAPQKHYLAKFREGGWKRFRETLGSVRPSALSIHAFNRSRSTRVATEPAMPLPERDPLRSLRARYAMQRRTAPVLAAQPLDRVVAAAALRA